MHRHGYKGRKFNRETDERRSMIKSLADSLIEHGSIETTLPKAKEIRPYVEKLVTKAKKGDLHSRRLILARLHNVSTAHKLVDEIAPKLAARSSGYLRIERTHVRRGDDAQLARISFVDDISATETETAETTEAAKPAKKSPAKKSVSPAKKVKA